MDFAENILFRPDDDMIGDLALNLKLSTKIIPILHDKTKNELLAESNDCLALSNSSIMTSACGLSSWLNCAHSAISISYGTYSCGYSSLCMVGLTLASWRLLYNNRAQNQINAWLSPLNFETLMRYRNFTCMTDAPHKLHHRSRATRTRLWTLVE